MPKGVYPHIKNSGTTHYRYGKKGWKHTSETKQRIANASKDKWQNPDYITLMKKRLPWNKGKKGQKCSEETRCKMRLVWDNPEYKKKMLGRQGMSSLEKKFDAIIQKYNLPYKFVGLGDFIIGRKCPDFINVNGEKIAIEVFYRGHKEKFNGGLKNWKLERSKIFAKFGWSLLFFDETEIEEKNVVKTLNR